MHQPAMSQTNIVVKTQITAVFLVRSKLRKNVNFFCTSSGMSAWIFRPNRLVDPSTKTIISVDSSYDGMVGTAVAITLRGIIPSAEEYESG